MNILVFDIETVGVEVDPDIAQYLGENRKLDWFLQGKLGLHPITGKIVCIGMYNVGSGKGHVFFTPHEGFNEVEGSQNDKREGNELKDSKIQRDFEENGFKYFSLSEPCILRKFWETIVEYDFWVTFNGMRFDIPFIFIRSALLGIASTVKRDNFNWGKHIDLYEKLTSGGLSGLPLAYYCKAFGIENPKRSTKAEDVQLLFKEGKGLEIANYCVRDVKATAELFVRLNKVYRFVN